MTKKIDWDRYEFEKKKIAWISTSSEEYERLMKELVEKLGI